MDKFEFQHLLDLIIFSVQRKKSLKIPKGQSETVYRSRTDNTMAKKKVQKDKQRSTKHTYRTKNNLMIINPNKYNQYILSHRLLNLYNSGLVRFRTHLPIQVIVTSKL